MASTVRLHEHDDFAAFITAAAAENQLPEVFVEKDYWITEILRVIATTLPDRAIFKGGTSLSKGWALLDRFSEDIDLFVDPLLDGTTIFSYSAVRLVQMLLHLLDPITGTSSKVFGKTNTPNLDHSTFPL